MAAVNELPIDKGDWHLILKFLCNLYQGILIHSQLSFWFSVLDIAGYDRLFGDVVPSLEHLAISGQCPSRPYRNIPSRTSAYVCICMAN